MTPVDDLEPNDEPLDDGGSLLIQLVGALDYLRRGAYPTLTVWSAHEQALRWHGNFEPDWSDPDPLLRALRLALSALGKRTSAEMLGISIRRWISATAGIFNESEAWDSRQPHG